MAMIFAPGQTPATFSQVIAWWPRALPGHSKTNPGAEWVERYVIAGPQP